MKVAVIGAGYVGLVQGAVLASFGMSVMCYDIDKTKIENLKQGIVPIYEPGLKELMVKNVEEGRLHFSDEASIAYNYGDVIFIAVGTPSQKDGSADLTHAMDVAATIGATMMDYKVVVNKSTVPVGTARLVETIIKDKLNERGYDIEFDIVSNPEFLREGHAINDALHPERVVIGFATERARAIMQKIYNVLYINQVPFVFTSLETAEMIKYAANSFLAVKISFINEIALLAEKCGANTQTIAKAMGMDGRIAPKFLHCGPGYGGSCLPKDARELVNMGRKYEEEMLVVDAAIRANTKQKLCMVKKIITVMGNDLHSQIIGVLGLSFKPETDDMREAQALDIIRGLVNCGAQIQAYCPQGMVEAHWRLADVRANITYCHDEYAVAQDCDALVLLTEWNQFRGLDLNLLRKNMKGKLFFDLRNVFHKNPEIRKIFTYYGVG